MRKYFGVGGLTVILGLACGGETGSSGSGSGGSEVCCAVLFGDGVSHELASPEACDQKHDPDDGRYAKQLPVGACDAVCCELTLGTEPPSPLEYQRMPRGECEGEMTMMTGKVADDAKCP